MVTAFSTSLRVMNLAVAPSAMGAPDQVGAQHTQAMALRVVKLKPTPLTNESFSPFGQLVLPTPDGLVYGPDDAQLHLSGGIPRFYIMRLEKRGLKFDSITHHANVTQCIGSVGAFPWYLGVAQSSIVAKCRAHEKVEAGHVNRASTTERMEHCSESRTPFLSHAGHHYIPPSPEEVQVFRVDGPVLLKLHMGTWHAGPLFNDQAMDFYNLELSDTNVVDHTTHVFKHVDGVIFEIDD